VLQTVKYIYERRELRIESSVPFLNAGKSGACISAISPVFFLGSIIFGVGGYNQHHFFTQKNETCDKLW